MLSVFIFIFGLGVGSFLNVVINRLDTDKSPLRGRSMCMSCRVPIAWYDNIPVVSFLLLRGHCRSCKAKISWQYPLVELGFGMALLLIWQAVGFSVEFFMYGIFTGFLAVIFVYDLKTFLILDRVSIPAIVVAFVGSLFLGRELGSLLIGAAIGAGFFALQFFVSKGKWVGDGDIRLGAVMGFMLGWKLVLVALFVAYLIGAAVGIALLLFKKREASSQVPFGPFLTLATFITLLYGSEMLEWYLSTLYL